MTIFHSIILGIIEGITEFLPISSTSHLLLINQFLKINNNPQTELFNVAIQGAAILAVLTIYTKKILSAPHLLIPLTLAFTPVAIIGLILELNHIPLQDNLYIVIASTFIVGIFMLFWNHIPYLNRNQITSLQDLTLKQSLIVGTIHCLALIPGFSRAGAAILGGLIIGTNRKTAIEFSFLLALPTLLSASVLKLTTDVPSLIAIWPQLLIGSLFALATSLISMRLFLNLTHQLNWTTFGIYRIIFGIIFVLTL